MTTSGGRREVVEVNGRVVECGTIGVLADTLGRSTRSILAWEKIGLIPRAPLRITSDHQNRRHRLYPITQIDVLQQVVHRERFGRRRRSAFYRQQQLLRRAWDQAMAEVMGGPRVTDHDVAWGTGEGGQAPSSISMVLDAAFVLLQNVH